VRRIRVADEDDWVWDPEFPEPDPELGYILMDEEYTRQYLIRCRDEARAKRAAREAAARRQGA
jgi:hypothetical protein